MIVIDENDNVKSIEISLTPSESLLVSSAIRNTKFKRKADRVLADRVYDKLFNSHVKTEPVRLSKDIQDRVVMLLECAYNLLQKQNESPFVLNMLEETIQYDGVECDGNCLLNDIEDVLGIIDIYPDEYSGKFIVE